MIFEYSILEEETNKAYTQIMGVGTEVPNAFQTERITTMAGISLFARTGINPAYLPLDEFGEILLAIRKAMQKSIMEPKHDTRIM